MTAHEPICPLPTPTGPQLVKVLAETQDFALNFLNAKSKLLLALNRSDFPSHYFFSPSTTEEDISNPGF